MAMLVKISEQDRFSIWYSGPLKRLEQCIDHGHGAIAALMVALPLYERWVRFRVLKGAPDNRPQIISDDLQIGDPEKAKIFWNVFRDGLCHTGSFFEESEKAQKEGWTLPKISLDGAHPQFPRFTKHPTTGEGIIEVNPWGLIHHILDKYEGNDELLQYEKAPLLDLHYQLPATNGTL
jgi:hypothetical protein